MRVGRSRIQDQVAVAVAVYGGGAVAMAVAGLTKRFFNHIQKDFLINVWGYINRNRSIFWFLSRWPLEESGSSTKINELIVFIHIELDLLLPVEFELLVTSRKKVI